MTAGKKNDLARTDLDVGRIGRHIGKAAMAQARPGQMIAQRVDKGQAGGGAVGHDQRIATALAPAKHPDFAQAPRPVSDRHRKIPVGRVAEMIAGHGSGLPLCVVGQKPSIRAPFCSGRGRMSRKLRP